MNKKYIVNIPIYDVRVNIYFGEKISELSEIVEDEFSGLKLNTDDTGAYACSFTHPKHGIRFCLLIPIDNFENHGTIAHECLHISYYILKLVGIKLKSNNHEAQAYLLGFLINEVMDTIEIYKGDYSEQSETK